MKPAAKLGLLALVVAKRRLVRYAPPITR